MAHISSVPAIQSSPAPIDTSVSAKKPIPKLTDKAFAASVKSFTQKNLAERVAIIQGSQLTEFLSILIAKQYLTHRLHDVILYSDMLSLCEEIKSFCYVRQDNQGTLVFSEDRFQFHFKPLLEEFVQNKPEAHRQRINVTDFQVRMAEQARNDLIKEMLGILYLCTIDNDFEFRVFLQDQAFIKEIIVVASFRYNVSIDDTRALTEVLKVNQTLTSLNLRDIDMEDDGACALAEALKVNHTLKSLNLMCNAIGDAGITALAEALKVNKTLISLNLTNNGIVDARVTELAEALKVNQTLTSLNLRHNRIENAGARELAFAMKGNRTLTSLELFGNQIGAAGIEALNALKAEFPARNIRY